MTLRQTGTYDDGQKSFTAGAAHVVDPTQVPRYSVTPTVSGTGPVGALRITRSAAEELACVRVTANPGTDLAAAARLVASAPDVGTVFPQDRITVSVPLDGSEGEITDLYFLAVNDTNATKVDNAVKVSNPASNVGDSVPFVYTSTQVINNACMVHFVLAVADKVREVVIDVSGFTDSNDQYQVTIRGRGYA